MRKGYAAAGEPDEDAFALPEAWRVAALPRRGGAVRPVPPPDPTAPEQERERIEADRDWVRELLAAADSDPTLVHAARAYLAGEPDPVGAAAVASMLPPLWRAGRSVDTPLVDAWVTKHGPAFAARAAVEAYAVEAHYLQSGGRRSQLALRPVVPAPNGSLAPDYGRTERLRELLATAEESAYQQAVAALDRCRTTPLRRVVAAFLAPGTPGWVADCLADVPGYGVEGPELLRLLLQALDHPSQVAGLDPSARLPWGAWTESLVATLADGVGVACVPLLRGAVEQAYGADGVREVTASTVRCTAWYRRRPRPTACSGSRAVRCRWAACSA
ncbi:hypothetical protein ACFYNO_12440 [Kitasatospora sp. NPDC006697]|uniref:hypothetical protein n=1 Tax=Kitasatospora sp. NPDC006697 TaxID=3364020 RepID=UPI0036B6B38E